MLDLSKLFEDVSLRYEDMLEVLYEMISGDPDATCFACYEPISECGNCTKEIFPEGWSPEKEIRRIEQASEIQFNAVYSTPLKKPHTEARLDTFWRKVRAVVRKYHLMASSFFVKMRIGRSSRFSDINEFPRIAFFNELMIKAQAMNLFPCSSLIK